MNMDANGGNANQPGRHSALPRPSSKLPKPRIAQGIPPPPHPPQTTSTSTSTSTSQPAPAALPKPSNGVPRLTKRVSTSSLSSSIRPPAKAPASKPVTSRTNLPGTRHIVKPSTTSTTSTTSALPNRSLAKPQKRVASATLQVNGEDEEIVDQLGSLDSFRSASRQGLHSNVVESPPLGSPDEAEFPKAPPESRGRDGTRPSLSDRTIESLQSIPTTPKERRRSSFFNPVESPMGPPLRPGSSLSRNGSRSRPGTSDGTFAKPLSRSASPAKRVPATAQPASRTTSSRLPSFGSSSSSLRSSSAGLTSKLQDVRAASQKAALTKKPSLPSLNVAQSKISYGNKPVTASRPTKPKTQLGEAFASPAKKSTDRNKGTATSDEPKRVVSNSSAALREQIAAAKAAARKQKAAAAHDSPQEANAAVDDVAFESDLHADPFNQAPKDEKHILKNRINKARMDGRLNIAAMGLKQIPDEVRSMYSAASMEESKVNWAEVVDLTKFIAADNEFEALEDAVFPDLSPEELDADDQTEGNQFGGLELLDLHNNSLSTVPMGLRRLERLTSLNLSHNKLDNDCADVISQIKTLKDLRLGHNSLNGAVPLKLFELPNLEILDLQNNRLLSLPEATCDLANLRVLNVSGNQLTALPMDALHSLPLTELDASNNALIASIFPLGSNVDGHPTLQILNAANNSLAALSFTPFLNMPRLTSLNMTNNHLEALPDTTGWKELITLSVGDNKISELPVGFTSLQKLRNANFTGNNIRLIDPEVGRMDSLEFFILASNPLREKKFLTMSAADIKRDLRSRLAPEDSADMDEPDSPVTVIGDSDRPSGSIWSLKNGKLLDLASKDLSDDFNDRLGYFISSNEVRQIDLQLNKITCIPPALSMGQDLRILDLSCNVMSMDYLSDELHLPALQELSLSKCRLSSLEPLITHLQAPKLTTLNVSANRLAGPLPLLRQTYPHLTTLFVHDNRISSISADALRGLVTINLSSNDIAQLPAEVGLLWDEGLRSLEIGANAFRVPNYHVLGKGTEAVLRWLRDRLPAGQGADRVEDVS